MIPIRGLRAPVVRAEPDLPVKKPRKAGGRRRFVDWDGGADEILRQLWDEGVTPVQIGEALGISRGGVYSRAARLGLPLRRGGRG
jgi:hypothetical protein